MRLTRRSLLALPAALALPDGIRAAVGEQAVLDEVQNRAHASLSGIRHARTPAEAAAVKHSLRPKLESSLGFRQLPWPPDLNLRTVGAVERPGHRIEKLVYEALPDMPVSAHLYLPEKLDKPAPAVGFYVGHWWPEGKMLPDFQSFCSSMARQGFVVLAWDPFGQGERGVSSRDHRRAETLLVGVAQQGLAEHETRCALEVLLSRKEVDPLRVGFTGASGGGYNTWITSVLDDRIAVAVSDVGTSEFYEQALSVRSRDWYHASEHCHFVPGLITYANNHEFLAAVAPKPLMIVCASADQSFPINGVKQVYQYGRELYGAFGAPEKIGFYEDSVDGHGYQIRKRQASYGWFRRWLMQQGDGSPWMEKEIDPLPWDTPELRCFPRGQNQPAGPGIMRQVQRLAKNLPPAEAKLDVRTVLGVPPAGNPPRVEIREARSQRLEIPGEGGVSLPALLQTPPGEWKGVLIALDDQGKDRAVSSLPADSILDKGWAICGLDVRGIGELSSEQMRWVATVSLLLNQNYVGRQAWDIARVAQTLGKPWALYARGDNVTLAAHYALALADPRFYILRDGFTSYRQFFDRPKSLAKSYALQPDNNNRFVYDREIPLLYFPFDALHHFDLPQLRAASQARGLLLNMIDGDWNPTERRDADSAVRGFLKETL